MSSHDKFLHAPKAFSSSFFRCPFDNPIKMPALQHCGLTRRSLARSLRLIDAILACRPAMPQCPILKFKANMMRLHLHLFSDGHLACHPCRQASRRFDRWGRVGGWVEDLRRRRGRRECPFERQAQIVSEGGDPQLIITQYLIIQVQVPNWKYCIMDVFLQFMGKYRILVFTPFLRLNKHQQK